MAAAVALCIKADFTSISSRGDCSDTAMVLGRLSELNAQIHPDYGVRLPVEALEAQVQLDTRAHLEAGGAFSAMRYDPAERSQPPGIAAVANEATLIQIEMLLREVLAHIALPNRQAGMSRAATVWMTVSHQPRSMVT